MHDLYIIAQPYQDHDLMGQNPNFWCKSLLIFGGFGADSITCVARA